jgi:phosphate transport system substrate-binding protein
MAAYGKAMAKDGMLEQRGLVPFGGAELAAATAQAAALKPLDPAGLN